jgi:hypothetical protein
MNLINKYKYLNIFLILYKIMKTTYFLLTLFIILTSYGIQAGVQYKYEPICLLHDCRKMITTTYTGTTTSSSRRIEKVSYDNTKGKLTVENTYEYQETSTRTSNAGADIGLSILGIEIKGSIGGETSFSKEEKFTVHMKVPPGKIGRVFLSEKKAIANFRHVIQPQIREFGATVWKKDPNPGAPMRIVFSTVTTISHAYSFETN